MMTCGNLVVRNRYKRNGRNDELLLTNPRINDVNGEFYSETTALLHLKVTLLNEESVLVNRDRYKEGSVLPERLSGKNAYA